MKHKDLQTTKDQALTPLNEYCVGFALGSWNKILPTCGVQEQ